MYVCHPFYDLLDLLLICTTPLSHTMSAMGEIFLTPFKYFLCFEDLQPKDII